MLQEYDRKRHFDETPEPKGKRGSRNRGNALEFVVQKHSASRLHFDFRLELDGVLVSWAVPKGPSLDPADKRLAVHVEDHPFEYRKFEGIIPARQYGAGEVIVWDKGTYEAAEAEGEPKNKQSEILRKGLEKGKISIKMHGEKLNGEFAIVKIRGKGEEWLLIKKDDDFAEKGFDITTDDESVLSDLTLSELQEKSGKASRLKAKEKSKVKSKSKSKTAPETTETAKAIGSRRAVRKKSEEAQTLKVQGRKGRMPTDLHPMLAKIADEPFTKPGWIYEPKLDGIRAIIYIKDGSVRMVSRRGLDLTGRYPGLAKSLSKNSEDVILDGEIVAIDEKGHPSFQLLQRAAKDNSLTKNRRIVYYAFDILYADGRTLYDVPLSERRKILFDKLEQTDVVKAVRDLGDDGVRAFKACVDMELEGIIAKRIDGIYQPGARTNDWLKIKSFKSTELLICGFSRGTGARDDTFGSLVLGYYDDNGTLQYAGSVGTGFNAAKLRELRKAMKPLERKSSPFGLKLRGKNDVVWVTPQLVAEIKYSEWTADGRLRIPVFMHLREDIDPAEVVRR